MPVVEEEKGKLGRVLDVAEALPCMILVACAIYLSMFKREVYLRKESRRKKCRKRI